MKLHVLILLLSLSMLQVVGQGKKNEPAPVPKGIAAFVAGMKEYPGFYPFYYDDKKDKIYLTIDKLDTEFLYVNSLAAGVGSNDIGLDRGQLGGERLVKFERRGPKVLLIQPNLRYRAITNDAEERRAVEESFAQSVLWGFEVVSEEAGKLLVDASSFLLQDARDVVGQLKETQQGSYALDNSRSAFYLPRTKNFPDNTEFEATLTFTSHGGEGNFVRSVTPTPSALTVRQHHSFVKLPDQDYKPRKLDPRSGYFGISYFDYATPISEPIEKRFIARHRLAKKDPRAAISEAVEPIVYYLDRGTPEPIRSALLDGARWWNQAFEAAGYKDAYRVEMMPEGADPMDVRYNVIQWIHRATRGWSYGSTVTDPRTGEIIKGHVSLGSLRVRQDYLIAEGLLAPYEEGKTVSKEMEAMALARLRQLSAHEVGHTLGLAHAYSSSTENFASVMDYPHPYVKLENGKIDLSKAYDDKIGAWDKVSVTYGYQDFPEGTDEDAALYNIIQQSIKNGLTFLSDQDARPLGGSHPYAHLWDNGKDAADELHRVMDIRSVALKNFGERNIKAGAPMATLEEVLVPVYFFHRYQTEAAVKLIGGLNYRYALRGDGQPVTEMVAPGVQAKALDALIRTITPASLMLPENVLKIIPPRPMEYSRHRELVKIRSELTFDALAAAESAADMTLGTIFHESRAGRLVEHHARDFRQPGLEQLIDKLTGATIRSGMKPGYEGALQRVVNESLLRNIIQLSLNDNASAEVKAIAALKRDQLTPWLSERIKTTADESWKAHYLYMVAQIREVEKNPGNYKPARPLTPPPGSPIGSDDVDFCGRF